LDGIAEIKQDSHQNVPEMEALQLSPIEFLMRPQSGVQKLVFKFSDKQIFAYLYTQTAESHEWTKQNLSSISPFTTSSQFKDILYQIAAFQGWVNDVRIQH